MEVVLQRVATNQDSQSQVQDWLTSGVVTVEVFSLVTSEQTSWGNFWGFSLRQSLVERHHIAHTLSIWVGAQVLKLV